MRKVVHVFKLRDIEDHTADPQYYTIHQLRDYGIDVYDNWSSGTEDTFPTLEEIKTSDDKLIEFFELFNFELEPIATITMDDFLQKTLTRV